MLENYSIFLPQYSIGNQVYEKIGEICTSCGKSAVIIGGKKALEAAGSRIVKETEKAGIEITGILWYGGECTYENVKQLMEDERVKKADMIFAVGGGKALDTGKCTAVKSGKPVFTFPTIASTCAACTSVSIMYEMDGRFKEPFFFHRPPAHSFINVEVIAKAPQKYMWAGMGDTFAKYYEATISSRGEELPHFYSLGIGMSRMCLDPILAYGKKAWEDNGKGLISYELEQVVLAIIVTTAIVSILVTKEHKIDYNTGMGHAVYYALTSLRHVEEEHMHGEVVALGILILLLTDGQEEEFKRLYAFHKEVGLPVKIEDIGVSQQELSEVLPKIAAMPDIQHNPYVVTEEMVRESFKKLENM